MIKQRIPLSMTESLEYIEDSKEKDSENDIKKFIKKFIKLRPEDAKKVREKLNALDLIKLKDEYTAKIIDTFPEDQESLSRIFVEMNLDDDEAKKILDILEEFK